MPIDLQYFPALEEGENITIYSDTQLLKSDANQMLILFGHPTYFFHPFSWSEDPTTAIPCGTNSVNSRKVDTMLMAVTGLINSLKFLVVSSTV